jgi:ABC-type multidrug transport system fused ATPase/permease subunit
VKNNVSEAAMIEKIKEFIGLFGNLKKSKWMFPLIKPFVPSLLLLLLLDTAVSLLGVASAVVSKLVVDASASSSSLIANVMLLVGVTVIVLGINMVSSLITTVINEKFTFHIRQDLFDKLLKTKWTAINKYHSGDLLTRLKSDVGSVINGITDTIPSIFTLFVRLVAAFFTLWYFDSSLAVFALIIGPFSVAISWWLSRKLKKYQMEVMKSESKYSAFLQESLENLLIIKSFVSEERSFNRLKELHAERLHWILKKNRMSVIAGTTISFCFSAGYLIAFIWGVVKLSRKLITYGTMTAFLSLVSQVQAPIISLARTIPQLVTIMASAERLSEIVNLEREPAISEIPCMPINMGISIDSMDFGYLDEKVLHDVTLQIMPGDTVAVVGPSGIGKTTLIRLLMSFIEPQRGSIQYTDFGAFTMKAEATSRRMIAYVPQGNTLFSGTIADNLRMAKPTATAEDICEALNAAAAGFVFNMPEGIETVIGERGLRLSEGQAQRISIARAIIRKAPLLILDEATSALDEDTEIKVLNAIRALLPRPTCIIITHRKSVLNYCNKQLELEKGEIRESELVHH